MEILKSHPNGSTILNINDNSQHTIYMNEKAFLCLSHSYQVIFQTDYTPHALSKLEYDQQIDFPMELEFSYRRLVLFLSPLSRSLSLSLSLIVISASFIVRITVPHFSFFRLFFFYSLDVRNLIEKDVNIG